MYDFNKIEKKWQKHWEEEGYGVASNDFSLPKKYNLVEFPYPSGVGMHLGHIKAYLGLEILSRKQRMEGYNVLFPMGFDAFGLPAENYAIKTHTHPRKVTDNNISIFIKQLKEIGFSFDYSRLVDTTDPNYYKWTQWIFLKMFENGLAFRDRTYVNFCPSCKVVLSNEDSQGGKCDRCDSDVVQKEKDVWFLRITEYAEKLLEGLDAVDFPPRVRLGQENWIGKSTGAFVEFEIKDINYKLKVYTTRPDTLFGATFMVIAPEHPMIDEYKDKISNYNEIAQYREKASHKTEFERTQLVKDKTGVRIEGLVAINPVNNEKTPIYISDYVMMGYGTGAIMAVPAHDDRDYEFANKFGIPIVPVIEKITGEVRPNEFYKQSIVALVYDPKKDCYLTINWGDKGGRLFVGGTKEDKEDSIDCAKREILEETGYYDLKYIRSSFPINHHYYAYNKNKAFNIDVVGVYFELISDKIQNRNLDEDEKSMFTLEWVDRKTIEKEIKDELHFTIFEQYIIPTVYVGDGKMINSDFLNGITTKGEAIDKMIEFLVEKGIGEKAVQFKMKDWAFNRQRYWGEPIPIVYCDKCGMVPVPYEELPLELPFIEKFEPGPNGESPLINIESFVNCKCPKCGENAKRETDTMPQWAGSSWYFLRYTDPNNKMEFASKEAMNYWMNVDIYSGGAEHITRHLIYSRFWHRFLYDIGVVNTKEPYKRRMTQGLILGGDNSKMSKSKGNTVDPLDIAGEYGADVLRTYVLFMGEYGDDSPWSEQGVKGISRFLDRIYRLNEIVTNDTVFTKSLETIIHKTIKKVSEDIDNAKYNTAISELMKLVNSYYEAKSITKADYQTLISLVYPFAPHLAEELNELNGGVSLTKSKWPIYDESKTISGTYEMVVQINGKVRGKIEVSLTTSEEEMKSLALNIDNVNKYLEGMDIVKVVTVPKKLVSIVAKPK